MSEARSGAAQAAWADALLDERARQLATPRSVAAPAVTTRALVCAAGETLYAVPLSEVARVSPYGGAARLPGAASAVLGVVSLSGAFFRVLELRSLVGAPAAGSGGGYVVFFRNRSIALRVDSALGVAELVDLSREETSGMEAGAAVRTFARAPADAGFGDHVISMLDLAQLPARAGGLYGETRVDR